MLTLLYLWEHQLQPLLPVSRTLSQFQTRVRLLSRPCRIISSNQSQRQIIHLQISLQTHFSILIKMRENYLLGRIILSSRPLVDHRRIKLILTRFSKIRTNRCQINLTKTSMQPLHSQTHSRSQLRLKIKARFKISHRPRIFSVGSRSSSKIIRSKMEWQVVWIPMGNSIRQLWKTHLNLQLQLNSQSHSNPQMRTRHSVTMETFSDKTPSSH